MVNKVILALVLFFVSCMLQAQTNISVDRYCLRKNAVTLSQALIDFKGKEFVSNLLNDNVSFSMICAVDSSGIIIDFKRIRSNKELPKELEQEIISYLKVNLVSFYICYEKPSGLNKEESLALIKRGLFTEGRLTHIISIGFPEDLMSSYAYERDKAKEEGKCLPKYEYLITIINQYKFQSE